MRDGGGRDPVERDCLVVQGQHVLALVNGQGAVRLAQEHREKVPFCWRRRRRREKKKKREQRNSEDKQGESVPTVKTVLVLCWYGNALE